MSDTRTETSGSRDQTTKGGSAETSFVKIALQQCRDPLSRDRDDHLAPGETEYYTQNGIPQGCFTCENCGFIARWELSAIERMVASRELA